MWIKGLPPSKMIKTELVSIKLIHIADKQVFELDIDALETLGKLKHDLTSDAFENHMHATQHS